MNIRIAILAAGAAAIALTAVTPAICGEKTFLDGGASKRSGAPKISENQSPLPRDRSRTRVPVTAAPSIFDRCGNERTAR